MVAGLFEKKLQGIVGELDEVDCINGNEPKPQKI